LLYHMITGRIPFDDPSPTMMQYLHSHARRPRPSAIAPTLMPFDDVIVRAMALEPGQRYADARSMLDAARSALHGSSAMPARSIADAVAILVSVRDRDASSALDDALLLDLEVVLPVAERILIARGFALAGDFGSSALFVTRDAGVDPIAAARAIWADLERGPSRNPRVQIGVCVHRGPVLFDGSEARSGPLLQPATWPCSDSVDGVWVTAAIDASVATATRIC
jgi:hypothetical protein